jgi:hypothetical protein
MIKIAAVGVTVRNKQENCQKEWIVSRKKSYCRAERLSLLSAPRQLWETGYENLYFTGNLSV